MYNSLRWASEGSILGTNRQSNSRCTVCFTDILATQVVMCACFATKIWNSHLQQAVSIMTVLYFKPWEYELHHNRRSYFSDLLWSFTLISFWISRTWKEKNKMAWEMITRTVTYFPQPSAIIFLSVHICTMKPSEREWSGSSKTPEMDGGRSKMCTEDMLSSMPYSIVCRVTPEQNCGMGAGGWVYWDGRVDPSKSQPCLCLAHAAQSCVFPGDVLWEDCVLGVFLLCKSPTPCAL